METQKCEYVQVRQFICSMATLLLEAPMILRKTLSNGITSTASIKCNHCCLFGVIFQFVVQTCSMNVQTASKASTKSQAKVFIWLFLRFSYYSWVGISGTVILNNNIQSVLSELKARNCIAHSAPARTDTDSSHQ